MDNSRLVALVSLVLLLLLTLPVVSADDWGQEMHDSSNTAGYSGVSEGSWTYDVGVNVDSRVVISDGIVYFFDEDGNLHALDVSERERKWVFESGSEVTEAPIVMDGDAYVESDGELVKLNSSGEVEWRYRSGSIDSVPAVSPEGQVYVGETNGLRAIDDSTGEEVWHTSFGDKQFGLVRVGDDDIYGLTMEEGAIEEMEDSLREGIMQDYWGERRVPSKIDYSRYTDPGDVNIQVQSVSKDGHLNWEFSDGIPTLAPAADGDRVFVSTLNYTLYAVDPLDGEVRWSSETDGTQRTPPVYYRGNVYIGTDRGTVYSFDGSSGNTVWRSELPFQDAPNLAFSDGTIFVTQSSRDDTVYAYDASDGEEIWTANLDGDITVEPTAVGSGVILASGSKIYSVEDGEIESPTTIRDEVFEDPDESDEEREVQEEEEERDETEPERTDDEVDDIQQELEEEIAEELDDGDTPILIPAVIGLLLIIAVGYVYRKRKD